MNKCRHIIHAVQSILGKPVYLTGGAVRDIIMDRPPKDYDLTTIMLPEEVEYAAKNAGRRVYTVGKAFGTVGFKVEVDGTYEYVEVTTFRKDGSGRKPDVAFVNDITADLSRRDFTMNAIAMRGDGTLIDPFGGREDIENDIIRAVGNPTQRFKEDPLRILRAARFVGQLGMFIEPATFKSMKAHAHRILEVSKERWMQELDKLLVGPWAPEGVDVLWQTGLMAYMLPELAPQKDFEQKSPYHQLPLHEHTISVVGNVQYDVTLKWAALLHDVGKPAAQTFKRDGQANYIKHDLIGAEMVESIALRLKWSNERRKAVKSLVLHHMDEDSPLREADLRSRG